MIHVIDYGAGNINSVVNIIRKVGGEAVAIQNPEDLNTAKKLILPGVGSFDHCMRNLVEGGWVQNLEHAVFGRKIPILGICVGMQLMCQSSEEGSLKGLSWFDAKVVKFSNSENTNFKIPHMGWNELLITRENPLIDRDCSRFYFVHSYYVSCQNEGDVLARTQYGQSFTSAFSKENIFGVQFHPEKSHRCGMGLMKNFVSLPC